MTTWNRRETHALVDALRAAGLIDAATAARAHELVDQHRPTRALELVRLTVPYAVAVAVGAAVVSA
jgi:hypothetical protein